MEDWKNEFKQKEKMYDRFAYDKKNENKNSTKVNSITAVHSSKRHSSQEAHRPHSNRVNYRHVSESLILREPKAQISTHEAKSTNVSKYFTGKVFDVSNFISSWNRPPITSQDLLKDDVIDYFSSRSNSVLLSSNLRDVIGLDDDEDADNDNDNSNNEIHKGTDWRPPDKPGLDNSIPIISRTGRNTNIVEAVKMTDNEVSKEFSKLSVQQHTQNIKENNSPNIKCTEKQSKQMDNTEDFEEYNYFSNESTHIHNNRLVNKTKSIRSQRRRNADVEFINNFIIQNGELVQLTRRLSDALGIEIHNSNTMQVLNLDTKSSSSSSSSHSQHDNNGGSNNKMINKSNAESSSVKVTRKLSIVLGLDYSDLQKLSS